MRVNRTWRFRGGAGRGVGGVNRTDNLRANWTWCFGGGAEGNIILLSKLTYPMPKPKGTSWSAITVNWTQECTNQKCTLNSIINKCWIRLAAQNCQFDSPCDDLAQCSFPGKPNSELVYLNSPPSSNLQNKPKDTWSYHNTDRLVISPPYSKKRKRFKNKISLTLRVKKILLISNRCWQFDFS